MSRITRKEVDERAYAVSAALYGKRVEVQGRCGYYGLDLYQGESLRRTLMTGTLRQVGDYLTAMIEAIDLTH